MNWKGLIPILILFSCIMPVQGVILVNADEVTSTSITWSWPPVANMTTLTIDGMYVCNFNPSSTSFILSGLGQNEPHTIIINTDIDSGTNTTTTLTDANIEQSTGLLSLANTWFLVGFVLILFLCGFGIHWFLFWVGSFVSLYGLADYILKHGSIEASIGNLPFWIYGALFILGFVLWAFRRKKGRWK